VHGGKVAYEAVGGQVGTGRHPVDVCCQLNINTLKVHLVCYSDTTPAAPLEWVVCGLVVAAVVFL
jgi:hypothetical protein